MWLAASVQHYTFSRLRVLIATPTQPSGVVLVTPQGGLTFFKGMDGTLHAAIISVHLHKAPPGERKQRVSQNNSGGAGLGGWVLQAQSRRPHFDGAADPEAKVRQGRSLNYTSHILEHQRSSGPVRVTPQSLPHTAPPPARVILSICPGFIILVGFTLF